MYDRTVVVPSTRPSANLMSIYAALLASAVTMMCLSDRATGTADKTPATTGLEYILGPRDKVRVKVFAWRPARDEVYEWKALNDVFTVGASGQLSMPLIGDVHAGGSSLNEVSIAIGEQLKSSLGLVDAPRASVEVVEFRPFYILGMVDKPGEYAYRPDLTIVQAVSIAGGLSHLNKYEVVRLDRDTISTSGERGVIEVEMTSLLARRARLDAEINGADTLHFPAKLQQLSGTDAGPLADEERIFSARLAAFVYRSGRLASTRTMLETQLASLQKHAADQDRHVQAAQQDLKRFDDLMARKLTTTTRRAEAARNLMQAEGEAVRLLANLSDARRELNQIEMEEQGLRDDRANQAVVEMRTTQARLDELERRIHTADTLMDQADAAGVQLSSYQSNVRKAEQVYTIIRKVDGTFQKLSATETTELQPGDTLKVEAPSVATPAEPERALDDPREHPATPKTTLTLDIDRDGRSLR